MRLPICLIILRSPERTKTEVVTIIHTQGDGPGPQDALRLCLHLDTPSSSNKIWRNYKGLKMNVQLGPTVDNKIKKDQKTKQKTKIKPNCHFWRARRESSACGWAGHVSCPLAQALDTPTHTPYKDQLAPTLRSEHAREPVLSSWFCLCSRGPNKDLREFLVWSFTNFYWLRKPRTLDGNMGGLDLDKTQEVGKEMEVQRWWGDWPMWASREKTPPERCWEHLLHPEKGAANWLAGEGHWT